MGIIRSFLERLKPSQRQLIEPTIEAELLRNDWSEIQVKATYAEGISRQMDGKPVFNDWNMQAAVKDGMKKTVWVYACVQKVALAVSAVPVIAVERSTREPLEGHPLNVLLQSPNPFWSRQDYFERLTQHLLLSGNAYISRAGGFIGEDFITTELWLLPPDQMRPVPSRTEYLSHYVRVVDGKERTVPSEEIVHLMLSDPGNPYLGMSPLQAAARTVDTEIEAITWNKVSLQNRAVADGMLSFAHDLNDVQYKQARLRVREQHMGSRNARVPWVMGNEARWVKMSETAVEMDFINSRRMTREEICAVFGVPPVLVGILDRATYSNYETARMVFYQDTVLPMLSNIEDGMTRGLLGAASEVSVAFDVAAIELLNAITKEVADTASVFWQMGVPFNVINERMRLKFPEFAGDDVSYIGGEPASLTNVDPFNDPNADDMRQASARIDSAIGRLAQLLTEASQGKDVSADQLEDAAGSMSEALALLP